MELTIKVEKDGIDGVKVIMEIDSPALVYELARNGSEPPSDPQLLVFVGLIKEVKEFTERLGVSNG